MSPAELSSNSQAEITKGRLVALKTSLETRARDTIINVYITTVGAKLANSTLSLIRSIVPDGDGIDLQHLRRFAKYGDVPPHVQALLSAASANDESSPETDTSKLLLIIGPVTSVTETVIRQSFSALPDPQHVYSIPVPLLAPTSQEQAASWSSRFWPTVYRKSNPFGPHPSIIARAEEEMRADVPRWMRLAHETAGQSTQDGDGEGIGVVIIERNASIGVARIAAVAGDARWRHWPCGGPGNATAHAALRAIAMIADGIKLSKNEGSSDDQDPGNNTDMLAPRSPPLTTAIFQGAPLNELERQHHHVHGVGDGYLCHNLEIYCTHEPCVMCSMAIVHSRFSRVVFQQRMPLTGGLCADLDHLGHGLFWRKELNWTLLAWHWEVPADESRDTPPNQELNA